MIILLWGKYKYKGLPMGISIELDMFQEGTSTLSQDMLHGCVYMEDMVITINYTYKKHMDILDDILNLLKNQGCR